MLSGIPLVIHRTITTLLFKFVRLVFTSFQQIIWKWNGTAQRVIEARLPENYTRCAHILDIVKQHQFDIMLTFTVEDFICLHNRFDSPRYVFDNDHISLLTVTDTDAVFVEATQPDMLLWRSRYTPFLKNSQLANCRRLIIIPLPAFHRMSEELGDPEGQLIFLFNTGRCGSTLLTQMFENTGACVTVSEPDTPNKLATLYRLRGDSEEFRRLTRDVIRWICRPYKSFPHPSAYVFKISSVSNFLAPVLTSLFPTSRCLYMYRDTVKMAQSVFRASKYLPSLCLTMILGKLSPQLTQMTMRAIGFAGADYRVRLDDDLTFGVLVVIRAALPYLELRRSGFPAAAIRYEDLIADPVFVCQKMFEFCGLPVSLVHDALETLKIDSQRNSPVSRELLSRHKDPELTPQSKMAANKHLAKYDLPLIGEECLLDGTISKKDS